MPTLTPDERRGALLVVALLVLGAAWDVWRGARVPRAPSAPSVVPRAALAAPAESGDSAQAAAATTPAPAARIDLNRAGPNDLERLPGIGPVLADRIVEHRRLHGRFRSVDELRAVRGVGPRLLERLRPLVEASP